MAPSYTTTATLRSMRAGMDPSSRAAVMERASRRSVEGSTFLSHSSADVELLPAVVAILENHDGAVYVDKKDPTLPPFTSRETATALRQRIIQARKFVLFATSQSKDSRWVPWELGIADGAKGGANTAVFPSVDSVADTQWAEREYLGVYERVVWGSLEGFSEPLWMVWNHRKNSAVSLCDWLRS
jgi:hypothetical protein